MKLTSFENLQIYDEEIKQYIKKLLSENAKELIIEKETFLQFPTIGNSNAIYIDITENKIYRFSETELKYYVVGSDYNDIELIDGNF